ncbi:integrase family protein [Pseudodesulfovibrio mercurii]|uniref:Integrase family protein n=1 Tax=Pseudodesulfovibrio mercurii TaxID=641491 RepID=F0JFT9_9BACT|nr:site-specific integrase [Pseudodesulfovibrio mercurii]EGB13767.1 integrase family protein [Pseudodesulfovibrio mercurii]
MSHIVLDGSTHHFRYRVPQQFHSVIGQQVIKVSLKTGNKRLANQRAERLASAVRSFFTLLPDTTMNTLSPADLKAKLRAFLEQCLYEDEGKRAMPPLEDRTPIPAHFPKDHEPSRLEMYIDEAGAGLAQSDYTFFGSYIDRFITQSGIEVAPDSTDFYRIARGVYEMVFDLLNVQHCRAMGDVLGEREYLAKLPPVSVSLPQPSIPVPLPQPTQPAPVLEAVMEKYIEDKTKSEWGKASIKDIPPQLRRFVEYVGSGIRIDELTRDHMRLYRDIITGLPNGNHIAKYRGKTRDELLAMDIPAAHRLKSKSLETNYTNVKSFLNWCCEEEFLTQANPLKSVLKLGKSNTNATTPKRRAFTLDELKALFENKDYHKGKFTHAANFWVPIIALFSGARLEEICQLYLDDIREIDGVMCFDINAEDDKDIKSEAGKRIVPIHPFLIEIGLLDRVAHLRANGEEHLFHRSTLSQADGKLSTNISKAFTYFRRKYGIGGSTDETSEVVFHSFRHTVITLGKHKRVDRRLVKEVVGHEEGEFEDVTGGYEGADPVKAKFEEFICQIDFDKVMDLGHLKGSMWITKR